MKGVRILPIVEGHGECEAVPVLLRRVANDFQPELSLEVLSPLRIPASKLLKSGEIERAVEYAARKLRGQGGIFILVDCDWEGGCPAIDGPELLRRAASVRPGMTVSVVLAKKEFEAWFLAAAKSLRGQRGLPVDLEAPPGPEEIRGAKEWLSARMPRNRGYTETEDQAALTARIDFAEARRCDSFDKCFREITRMFDRLTG